MIHVILTILKILGIIILILLGIILFVLLTVLTVPVRCRITGYYKDKSKDIYAKIDLSWLLHLVLYRFVYQGGIQENNLKILGRKVYPREKKVNPEKKKNRRVKDQKKNQDSRKQNGNAEISQIDKNDSQIKTDENQNAENYNGFRPIIPYDEDTDSRKNVCEDFFERIKKKISAVLNKIRLFFTGLRDKIKNKYQNIKDKASDFIKKAADIRSFVQDSENIEAVKSVLLGVKNLLVHMRPRKMKINGVIGFDDPALTGQLFAVLGILYPYYGENTNITASFEEKVIDVEFDIRGRLILMYAVFIVIKLLANKRIRKWIFRN